MTYWVRVFDDASGDAEYWPTPEEDWQPASRHPNWSKHGPWPAVTVPCRSAAAAAGLVARLTRTPPSSQFGHAAWTVWQCVLGRERDELPPRADDGDLVVAVIRPCPITARWWVVRRGPVGAVVLPVASPLRFEQAPRLDVTSRDGRRNLAAQITLLGIAALLG